MYPIEKERCLIRRKDAKNWRKPTQEEFDDIYYTLVDDAPAKILDRVCAGLSIVQWKLGKQKRPYEIKFLIS